MAILRATISFVHKLMRKCALENKGIIKEELKKIRMKDEVYHLRVILSTGAHMDNIIFLPESITQIIAI